MNRRRLLASLGASALGGVAGCAALPGDGDAGADRRTVAPDLRGTPTPTATPDPADLPDPVRWRAGLAGVEATALTAGVAVALTGGGRDSAGSAVVGFDVATGERRWRRGIPPASGLAAAGDRVYAGSWSWFRAFDAATGEERWRADGAPFPLVVEGGAFSTGEAGAALRDPADGSVRWRRDPPADGDLPYPVAAVAGAVVLVGRDGALEGLELDTGERRFRLHAGGAVTPYLAAHDDRRLYVGADARSETARLVGVDAAAGDRLFAVDPGGYWVAPHLGGGTVYAGNRGREFETLRARDAETGAVRWERSASVDAAGPTGAFDRSGADLRAFDAADGSTRWRASPGVGADDAGGTGDAPALVGGVTEGTADARVLAGGTTVAALGPAGLAAYDAATGEARGSLAPDGAFAPRRASRAAGTLLAPTDEALYAVSV